MNCASGSLKNQKHLSEIVLYVGQTSGLKSISTTEGRARIQQSVDGKSIEIDAQSIEDVLFRSDCEGADFIQVNFSGGRKVLLTDALIGFKPLAPQGLDSSRLPRVVTTPDVINVFEAIQDALHVSADEPHEIAILKKVFDAVLLGGEAVGFDLSTERSWIARIPSSLTKISS